MKKVLLIGASTLLTLLFSNVATAAATAVCDGTAAGGDKTVTKATSFIVNTFTMKCSSNVFLAYEESGTAVGVGAASKKGKNQFSGSSAGGQVKPTGTACAATGCTATDASTPASAALAAAAST